MVAWARQRTADDHSGETSLVAPFEQGAMIDATVPGVAIRRACPGVRRVSGIFVLVSAGLFVWRRKVTPRGAMLRAVQN